MPRWLWLDIALCFAIIACGVEAFGSTQKDDNWKQLRNSKLILEYRAPDEKTALAIWPELLKAVQAHSTDDQNAVLMRAERMKQTEDYALQLIASMTGLDKPSDIMRKTYRQVVKSFSQKAPDVWKCRLLYEEDLKSGSNQTRKISGFTYDISTELFTCNYQGSQGSDMTIDYLPIFAVKGEPAAKLIEGATSQIKAVCDAVSRQRSPVWLVYHETAEAAIVWDHHIYSRFRRWFCDGTAQVIAEKCTKEIFGDDYYKQTLSTWGDATDFETFRRKVNLLGWRAAECENDLPFQMDIELCRAHYYFATKEMRDLADRHGTEVLPKILNQISRLDAKDSESIYQAIHYITGEDMKTRLMYYGLAAYDPFPGIAICYTSTGYINTEAPDEVTATDKIPLILDGKHAITFQFDYGLLNPSVKSSVELQSPNGKSVIQTIRLDNKNGRACVKFPINSELKPGRYQILLNFKGKLYKRIPLQLVSAES